MIGILIFTFVALMMALLTVFISEKFKKDSKEKEFEGLLPGLNCGVCGYGTCLGMAKEMDKDVSAYQKCKPLYGEKKEKLENYLRSHSLI